MTSVEVPFRTTGSTAKRRRGPSVVAAVLEDLLANRQSPALETVLSHALDYSAADTAVLSLPLDEDRLQIRAVSGSLSGRLFGQTFDRRHSIPGQVIADGRPRLVTSPRDAIAGIDLAPFGGGMMVPLRAGDSAVGALGLLRLRRRPQFEPADVEDACGFAELADIAMQLDEAAAHQETTVIRAERDRLADALVSTVISSLSELALQLDALQGYAADVRLRVGLNECVDTVDTVVHALRDSIYPLRTGTAHADGHRTGA